MHKEARSAATAFNTLDYRPPETNLRLVMLSEDAHRPAGIVIPYAQKSRRVASRARRTSAGSSGARN